MSNLLQKRLAENIANGGLKKFKTKKDLLVTSGYKPITADRSAKTILKSPGLREELGKIGFTEDKAKGMITEILDAPLKVEKILPLAQIMAAQEVFKVFGTYAPIKQPAPINVQKAIIILPTELVVKYKLNADSTNTSPEENSK